MVSAEMVKKESKIEQKQDICFLCDNVLWIISMVLDRFITTTAYNGIIVSDKFYSFCSLSLMYNTDEFTLADG